MKDKSKSDKLGQKSRSARKLRDQTVISKAMQGERTQKIADDLGIARTTVSAILNSDEVKAKIKEIDQHLAQGINDAIETVLTHVKYDYKAAYDLLKNFGSMKTTMDLNHNFPKPTIIERRDGSQVILGTDRDYNNQIEERDEE